MSNLWENWFLVTCYESCCITSPFFCDPRITSCLMPPYQVPWNIPTAPFVFWNLEVVCILLLLLEHCLQCKHCKVFRFMMLRWNKEPTMIWGLKNSIIQDTLPGSRCIIVYFCYVACWNQDLQVNLINFRKITRLQIGICIRHQHLAHSTLKNYVMK